jgi:hypothetical protein
MPAASGNGSASTGPATGQGGACPHLPPIGTTTIPTASPRLGGRIRDLRPRVAAAIAAHEAADAVSDAAGGEQLLAASVAGAIAAAGAPSAVAPRPRSSSGGGAPPPPGLLRPGGLQLVPPTPILQQIAGRTQEEARKADQQAAAGQQQRRAAAQQQHQQCQGAAGPSASAKSSANFDAPSATRAAAAAATAPAATAPSAEAVETDAHSTGSLVDARSIDSLLDLGSNSSGALLSPELSIDSAALDADCAALGALVASEEAEEAAASGAAAPQAAAPDAAATVTGAVAAASTAPRQEEQEPGVEARLVGGFAAAGAASLGEASDADAAGSQAAEGAAAGTGKHALQPPVRAVAASGPDATEQQASAPLLDAAVEAPVGSTDSPGAPAAVPGATLCPSASASLSISSLSSGGGAPPSGAPAADEEGTAGATPLAGGEDLMRPLTSPFSDATEWLSSAKPRRLSYTAISTGGSASSLSLGRSGSGSGVPPARTPATAVSGGGDASLTLMALRARFSRATGGGAPPPAGK